jgi:hypothetical protein
VGVTNDAGEAGDTRRSGETAREGTRKAIPEDTAQYYLVSGRRTILQCLEYN